MTTIVWILLVIFVLMDIFFALMRAALFNARLPQLIELAISDDKNIERTIRTLERPRMRTTMRLLVALTHALVLTCVLYLVLTGNELGFGAMLGIFVLTILLLLGFEFSLERLPLHQPETWSVKLAPLAIALDTIFTPITSVLVGMQNSKDLAQRNLGSVTEDELKTWVEVGQPEGGLEEDERKMIYSIFQFGDTLCREIMVPRIAVLAVEIKTPLSTAINMIVESGHSRVPVYDDVIDNVVGMLYAKDLLKVQVNAGEKSTIRKFLRPAYFIPESKKVDELLGEMQSKGVHIAVVVDEYGGMAGLVTLEDIVEEIVGEIRDEYDQAEELLVQQISPEEYVFVGRVSLDDFNEALSTELETDQTDTLGGFFYSKLGRVPMENDRLVLEDWQLTVEEVRGRRVGRIRAIKITEPQNTGAENDA